MKKIWTVKDKVSLSDEELINAIKLGEVTGDDFIKCDLLNDYIRVNDSIYQFYLKGNENETI